MSSTVNMQDDGSSASNSLTIASAHKPLNGPVLIALNVAWLLYGCYLNQVYHFFNTGSASQNRSLRILVIVITITGTLHVSFATNAEWEILVVHWGDPSIWTGLPLASALGPFTAALNGFIVQFFFVTRILSLSTRFAARLSACAIAITSVLGVAGSIGSMVLFLKIGSSTYELDKLDPVIRLWSISSVLCDVLIASTMSLILFSARSKTNNKSMRKLLEILLVQSIETGTITAVTVTLFLIWYEMTDSSPSGIYLIWEWACGPLYGNVLLFILNLLRNAVPDHERHITLTSPSSILGSKDLFSTTRSESLYTNTNSDSNYGSRRIMARSGRLDELKSSFPPGQVEV